VPDTLFFTKIRKALHQIASKPNDIDQKPEGNRPASLVIWHEKIGSNGSVSVEGNARRWYTTRGQFEVLRKRMLGSVKTQCSSIF